jgi:succinyl-diaminopimelate desuccinylase
VHSSHRLLTHSFFILSMREWCGLFRYDEVMTFTSELELSQALIQTPSPSRQESAAMRLMLEVFKGLSFDEAYLDKAGDAIGVFRRGDGPHVMLNGHLDTVALGDESAWQEPPLSGNIVDGNLWGRGSVDMKSAVACMTFAARDAIDKGFRGTLSVSAVVQEEIGGLGARYLGDMMKTDVVILGEPSNLNLMLGHRGRLDIEVAIPGKIAHAAKSELGDNAIYRAMEFLEKVKRLELPKSGILGGSSITPTLLTSYPRDSYNVVPGRADINLDYRMIPGDEPRDILGRLQPLAPHARFKIPLAELVSEDGSFKVEAGIMPPYLAPGESKYVTTARQVIKENLQPYGVPYGERTWWFGTDAPHLAKMGAVVVGFGPGNEELAHTTRECVPVEHLRIARDIYTKLVLAYSG